MATATAKKLNITLPPLHTGRPPSEVPEYVRPDFTWTAGGQKAIFDDPSRFKCVVCGRRYGKTTFGVEACVATAIGGGRTWWVAPSYKLAYEGWIMLKQLAYQLPREFVEIREGDKQVIFNPKTTQAGSVEIRSGDNEGSNRGAGLDGLVLDEFNICRESLWTDELRATLTDHKGWGIFIGTPQGKNWGYRLYQNAGLLDGWARFRRPTVDNPYIDPEEVYEAKLILPDEKFKQEYEADFGASQFLVYPDFSREFHSFKEEIPQFDHFFGGLDFGGTTIGSHKSAGIFAGYWAARDTLVCLEEFEESGANIAERQLNWMGEVEVEWQQKQRRLGHKVASTTWRADKTQMAFIQIIRNAGYHILPSKGGSDSVANGIELVQRRLKTREDIGKARLLHSPLLRYYPEAMERYRYPEFKEGDDKVQSKNPLKVNDDMVDAVRYLVEGVDMYVMGDPNELFKNLLPRVA